MLGKRQIARGEMRGKLKVIDDLGIETFLDAELTKVAPSTVYVKVDEPFELKPRRSYTLIACHEDGLEIAVLHEHVPAIACERQVSAITFRKGRS